MVRNNNYYYGNPACRTNTCGNGGRSERSAADRRGDNVSRRDADSVGCGTAAEGGMGLEDLPLAMVYAPLQRFTEIYEPKTALERGTIFAELDLPLLSVGTQCGGANRHG